MQASIGLSSRRRKGGRPSRLPPKSASADFFNTKKRRSGDLRKRVFWGEDIPVFVRVVTDCSRTQLRSRALTPRDEDVDVFTPGRERLGSLRTRIFDLLSFFGQGLRGVEGFFAVTRIKALFAGTGCPSARLRLKIVFFCRIPWARKRGVFVAGTRCFRGRLCFRKKQQK